MDDLVVNTPDNVTNMNLFDQLACYQSQRNASTSNPPRVLITGISSFWDLLAQSLNYGMATCLSL